MKKIIVVLALLLVCGCVGSNSQELMNSYNSASYKDSALVFIKGTSVYHDSGFRATCADAKDDSNGDWTVACFFNSRDDDANHTNKISTHNITIRYSGGKIVDAIEDNKYNLLEVNNVKN